MTIYGLLFYILAAVLVAATGLAVTRRVLMHALVYLIIAFLDTALIFYLLGAPLLAFFQVIIYAGAIMVLFVFVVMLMRSAEDEHWSASFGPWLAPAGLGLITLGAAAAILLFDPQAGVQLRLGLASPRELGDFLFRKYWLAVEGISLLLFAALAGAYYLGKAGGRKESKEEQP